MKFLIVFAGVLACAMAQYGLSPYRSNYNFGRGQYSGYSAPRFQSYRAPAQLAYRAPTQFAYQAPAYNTRAYQFQPAYARNYASQAYNVVNDQGPDGSYRYSFQAPEIAVEASGAPKNLGRNAPVVSQGAFQWTSPEGVPVSISYVADEYGYRAAGDAIPTPPPVPEAIQRSIAYNQQYQARRYNY